MNIYAQDTRSWGARIQKWITALVLLVSFSFLVPVVTEAASAITVTKGQTTQKVIALTFDDGSDGKNTDKILKILKDNNVPATFFLTGSGAHAHPQFIKNIVHAGHEIGNHSYTHPHFTQLSAAQITSELQKTEAKIQSLTGKTTKPLFRPPYGEYDAKTLQAVGNAGYTHSIMWTVDTLDWKGTSASAITKRVMDKLTPGAIVLMHTGEGAPGTPAALPGMIQQLKAKGYTFVTVGNMLKLPQPPSTGTTYTVQPGDTLYRIAKRWGVTVEQLAEANAIPNIHFIRVGQQLTIPGKGTPSSPPVTAKTYTVKGGDTLYGIARKFGTTVPKLAEANRLSNVNLIRIGQVLTIPGATTTTPPPASPIVYTVKKGDTLYSIAKRYGVTVQTIVDTNNISNASLIYVGQRLTIPRK